jgi:2,3-bisphosphoglycerate-dependent phosphoglycerate mutase
LLLESGYEPDVIYTSRLKRAIKSAWAIVQEINAPFLPMYKSWRLNERHYGALQGLCKKETAQMFGSNVVQAWRRSLYALPPPLKNSVSLINDRKVSGLLPEQIPRGESLQDCMRRTEPLWKLIKRDILKGKNVIVVAHANTLRGLAKIIDGEFFFLHYVTL